MRLNALAKRINELLAEHGPLPTCHANLANDDLLPISASHIDVVNGPFGQKVLIIMNPQKAKDETHELH